MGVWRLSVSLPRTKHIHVNNRLLSQEGRGGCADDGPAGVRRVHLPASHAGLPNHRAAQGAETQPCRPTPTEQQPTL